MRRACLLLLAGCGFKGPTAKQVDPDATPGPDAALDASLDADIDAPIIPGAACWTAKPFDFDAAACASSPRDRIDISNEVVFDTTSPGTSTPPGLSCADLDNNKICALAANSIRISPGAALIVHGARPLALLAHSIQIEGTLEVASHVRGQNGPGAGSDLCNSNGADAKLAGGGAGGTYSGDGGNGGEQGGATGTAGQHGSSISKQLLRAGCSGGRGGDGSTSGGPPGGGGAGGGALWLAIDTGTLVLGPTAVINASGASGLGGPPSVHGGYGGGSGGLIVLQAPTIQLNATTKIFANGGGGGGGSQGGAAGRDGTDSTNPTIGGIGGPGGPPTAIPPGGGGNGYPDLNPDGADGDSNTPAGGGGGGGGGQGVIRVFSNTSISSPNISPPPTN